MNRTGRSQAMVEAENTRPSGNWLDGHSETPALFILAAGSLARLLTARGTFLNPDEALHFLIANQASWALAYKASLTMAHPPLLIFLLYWWRMLGTSEFMLRLPSVLAGTAFCWMYYKWLKLMFGRSVALAGLILASLLPAMVILSSEVRQYELLLMFLACALYFQERAFRENSAGMMLLSAAGLYLAMLSHYSAFLFAAANGVYGGWYLLRRFSSRLAIVWGAVQCGALGIAVFFYVSHISQIKGSAMTQEAMEGWLYKSYFHLGHGNPVLFVAARTFSVFQYILGQLVVGDLTAILFVVGIVVLLKKRMSLIQPGPSPAQVATFLILPFVLNCEAALRHAYPYGGTRHSVFLVIFAIAGIGLCLASLAPSWIRTSAITFLIVLICAFVQPRHPQYIARVDQSRMQMDHALAFVRDQIPGSDLILVDYETSLTLGYYMCAHKPVTYDHSLPGFETIHCDGRRIVSLNPDLWALNEQLFFTEWNQLVQAAGLKPGDSVWVGQAGWVATLASQLQKSPQYRDLKTCQFGRNIVFFKVNVT